MAWWAKRMVERVFPAKAVGFGSVEQAVARALRARPVLAAAAAGATVAALAALLVWFVAFSGLSGPVQFVYSNF